MSSVGFTLSSRVLSHSAIPKSMDTLSPVTHGMIGLHSYWPPHASDEMAGALLMAVRSAEGNRVQIEVKRVVTQAGGQSPVHFDLLAGASSDEGDLESNSLPAPTVHCSDMVIHKCTVGLVLREVFGFAAILGLDAKITFLIFSYSKL